MLTIATNTRLRIYRHNLISALRLGYKIGGISDFLYSDRTSPYLILRHDVDRPSIGVSEMFAVEQDLGIKSSWYFRWVCADRELINRISSSGSEVSLHFETLATICKAHGITTSEEITQELVELARLSLQEEIMNFRRQFTVPCRTIASHGDLWNRLIGIANHQILNDELRRRLDITAEAYDSLLIDQLDAYICDADLLYNAGWSYQQSLKDALLAGHHTICFLSHPHHWCFSMLRRLHLLKRIARCGIHYETRRFNPFAGGKLP